MNSTVKTLILLLTWVLFGNGPCGAGSTSERKTPLRCNAEGQFKIVQFTDLHLKEDNEEDEQTLALMEQILDAEKPHLVVLTGDVLGASAQPRQIMKLCAEPMVERQIPWAGNRLCPLRPRGFPARRQGHPHRGRQDDLHDLAATGKRCQIAVLGRHADASVPPGRTSTLKRARRTKKRGPM